MFTYWQGPRTPLVDLCLESIHRHHPGLQILDPAGVSALGGQEILDRTADETIAYRSDLLRWWLMKEFGGVWFDADMIFFQPTGLIDILQPHHEFAGFTRKRPGHPHSMPCDQHFAMRQGKLADIAYKKCLAVLRPPFRYGDTNRKPIAVLWAQASERIVCVSHWKYSRIPFHQPWRLMRQASDEEFRVRPELWPKTGCKPFSVHLGGYAPHALQPPNPRTAPKEPNTPKLLSPKSVRRITLKT